MFRAWFAVLVLLVTGASTLTLVCSDLRRWNLAAKIGLSFGFGLVILTITLFILSLCDVKPAPWIGLAELLLWLVIVIAVRRDKLSDWLPSPDWQGASYRRGFGISQGILVVFLIGIFLVV